jgi:O-antigen/teichoic acid export membrane protein
MLRLFGHFGLLAQQTVITPAFRLAGSALAFALDGPLAWYLAAWFVAAYAGAAVMVWQAWSRAAAQGLLAGFRFTPRGLGQGSPGLWRFMLVTNVYSTLALVPNHLATYLVGAVLGPAAAGLFKVAREIGTALGKPADLLNQTLYPDMARLALAGDWRQLLFALLRACGLAALLALLLLALVFGLGEFLIGLIFGQEFRAAAPVLELLVVAAAISMLVFAAEPVLYALGRPGTLLAISIAGNGLLFALMLILMPRLELPGAGWAAVGAAALSACLLAGATFLSLHKAEISTGARDAASTPPA